MAARVTVWNTSQTVTLEVMAVKSPYTIPPRVSGPFDIPPGAGKIVVASPAGDAEIEMTNVSDSGESLATMIDGKEGRLKPGAMAKVAIKAGGSIEVGLPQ